MPLRGGSSGVRAVLPAYAVGHRAAILLLENKFMKLGRPPRVVFWILLFAVIGAALGFSAFLSGVADSGYAVPSTRTTVLGTLALWPEFVCGRTSAIANVGLCNSLRTFGNTAPLFYLFGIPAIGWAIIGGLIGAWLDRCRDSHASA